MPRRPRIHLDGIPLHIVQRGHDDIRLALNQSQPLGNTRFYAKIEQMTGQKREARLRGRPRMEANRNEIRPRCRANRP